MRYRNTGLLIISFETISVEIKSNCKWNPYRAKTGVSRVRQTIIITITIYHPRTAPHGCRRRVNNSTRRVVVWLIRNRSNNATITMTDTPGLIYYIFFHYFNTDNARVSSGEIITSSNNIRNIIIIHQKWIIYLRVVINISLTTYSFISIFFFFHQKLKT